MDFFERQDRARRHTKWLVLYFMLAVAGIILSVYLVAAVLFGIGMSGRHHHFNQADQPGISLINPTLFLGVAGTVLFVICCGSAYKTMQLSGGGSAVAEMLGGRPVAANTADPNERKLLNVVQEMAIASGTPVPNVYVLDSERGINAFAAGHSTSDMVVCATRGCLDYLTRDELQGVIGHEFSHILNGDMRLNLRLMGMVFGILCIATVGRVLLYTRSSGDRDRNNVLPLLGLALLAIGGIGVFFGKLIKSAVSREREFLADASSVQFTRNAGGLADALKKVGGGGSRVDDPNAEDASHLFFANGLSESIMGMFSTHPPIEDRIRALDPGWDGKFLPLKPLSGDVEAGPRQRQGQPPMIPGTPGMTVAGAILTGAIMQGGRIAPQVGRPTSEHLEYAADLRANLPPVLADAARQPMSAVALIYSLLISSEEKVRTEQLSGLQSKSDAGVYAETIKLLPEVDKLESRARLPIAMLAVSALRALSPAQYTEFTNNLGALVEADGQIDLFEYTVQKLVQRHLDTTFNPPRKPMVQYYVLKPLLPDAALLLSALANAGQDSKEGIVMAFRRGAQTLNAGELPLMGADSCDLEKVDAALDRLNTGALPVKKQVINACAETVAADGQIQESEAELLRAIADALDCPIPPFVNI